MPLDQSLSAGTLNKQVVLEVQTTVDDGGGGATITWSDGPTCWASIEQGAGREFVVAQQLEPELSHVVTIRYRPNVTPLQRLKYTGNGQNRRFVIHSIIDPSERHEQLQLYCAEVVPT